jgi:hypothetical protein
MISLLNDSQGGVTRALRQWRSRTVMPTELSSAEISELGREVLERGVFSARVTNADFLQRLSEVVDEQLAGRMNMATARWELMKMLKVLGYHPETGFPGQLEAGHSFTPAERGTLQDLSSEQRLNLMLETNRRMAANFGLMIAGNRPIARRLYPAWEFVRLYSRVVPRGSPESESPGWYERWPKAGQSVGFVGALDGPLIALKDSPIWEALGAGVGGYRGALGNPYPPFAFNSGWGWKAVSRERCVEEGLIGGDAVPAPMKATLLPGDKEVLAAFDRLSPELRDRLRRQLAR